MEIQQRIELTVALPAYREAASLNVLLPVLNAQLRDIGMSFEILVVDSATALDETAEVCARNDVRHVRRRGGERYGDAVRTAIQDSLGAWVLFMDADGSHPPSAIVPMWASRGDGELVIGSRYVDGGATGNSRVLVGMSLLLNTVFRTAFSLPCRDVTNSLRLYRADLLKTLPLESENFDILQEILIKLAARRPRVRIIEVPMTFLPRSAGESKRKMIPFIISYLRTMARMWRFRRTD